MPAGLQLFYPDGKLNLDTSTGIPRYLGVTPSQWSGSVNVPEWATQRPWFKIVRETFGPSPLRSDNMVVTVSGTTLTWVGRQSASYQPSRILYGCY